MNKQEYIEALKDPRWQKKRLHILERDNFTCQACRCTTHTLHIHHKKYIGENLPWEYEDKDLITYCEYCHIIIPIFEKFTEHKFRNKIDVIQGIDFVKDYIIFNVIIKRKRNYLYIISIKPYKKSKSKYTLCFLHKVGLHSINYFLQHGKFEPH